MCFETGQGRERDDDLGPSRGPNTTNVQMWKVLHLVWGMISVMDLPLSYNTSDMLLVSLGLVAHLDTLPKYSRTRRGEKFEIDHC